MSVAAGPVGPSEASTPAVPRTGVRISTSRPCLQYLSLHTLSCAWSLHVSVSALALSRPPPSAPAEEGAQQPGRTGGGLSAAQTHLSPTCYLPFLPPFQDGQYSLHPSCTTELPQVGFLSCSPWPCCLHHFCFFRHFTGISQWKWGKHQVVCVQLFSKVKIIKLLCNYLITIIKNYYSKS